MYRVNLYKNGQLTEQWSLPVVNTESRAKEKAYLKYDSFCNNNIKITNFDRIELVKNDDILEFENL